MSYIDFITTFSSLVLLLTPWLVFGAIMWKLGNYVQPHKQRTERKPRVKVKTRMKHQQHKVDIITDTCPTCGWYELKNGECESCGSESKK